MATEDLKSTGITNADATPTVLNNSRLDGAEMICAKGHILTTLAITGVGSTYRMVRLPQNAMVHAVLLSNDNMGTGGDTDVGIYLPNGGAVVDANHFGTAADINTAVGSHVDVTHKGATAGAYGIEDVRKPLWEALGDTIDTSPDGYDVVLTITEASSAVGDLTLEVQYTV